MLIKQNYRYPHDFPNHYVKQQYLPDDAADMVFYRPSGNGYEKTIDDWLRFIRENKEEEDPH